MTCSDIAVSIIDFIIAVVWICLLNYSFKVTHLCQGSGRLDKLTGGRSHVLGMRAVGDRELAVEIPQVWPRGNRRQWTRCGQAGPQNQTARRS